MQAKKYICRFETNIYKILCLVFALLIFHVLYIISLLNRLAREKMSKYLLEIGTEELPHKFIPSAQEQLKKGFEKLLNDNQISYGEIKTYATPRRLAVKICDLPEKQADVEKVLKGPIAHIAFDENKNLTPAGLGFAKKNGVAPENLYIEDNYVFAKVEQKGKLTKDILSENVESIVLKLQGSHFMRWADLEVKFQRPIRWVVSIFDNEELPVEIAKVKSSRFSRGHRFKSDKVEIKSPDDYVSALRENNVYACPDERRETIVSLAKEAAAKIGAEVALDNDLVDEVSNLTEYPVPAICSFDEKYLNIPEKVNVTVMATHQRYFPLYKNGKLLNKFITMTNYIGNEFENIKAGNERVVVARLEDGLFFFEQDTKTPLADKENDLKGVTFQKGMGTMFDKTERIEKLSKYLADEIGADDKDILRTAKLCKCDLVTKLVFEFTELQGFIGGDYARISGEKENVAKGITEHYFPLGTDSELASTIEGQIVGISDKIDTVCAVFADGRKPTGSADPLGVRRAVLGILKTVIANNLKINLSNLIKLSVSLLPKKAENEPALLKDINEFFTQRLVILYSGEYSHDVLEACVSGKDVLADLSDFVKRLELVNKMVKSESYGKFHEAANRIIRIIKDSKPSDVDEKLLKEEAEKELYKALLTVKSEEYAELSKELMNITCAVDKFFEDVLVMDKDESIKANRINLLGKIKEKFEKIADFSKIVK